jgi:hypothetical protein
MLIAATEVAVIGPSGSPLGRGRLNIYAPQRMHIHELSRIRVEVVLTQLDAPIIMSLDEVTATPSVVAFGYPTATLPPISGFDGIHIYYEMGVQLSGADLDHFMVEAQHETEIQTMEEPLAGATITWEWDIRPLGEEALGDNRFTLLIYTPANAEGEIWRIYEPIDRKIEVVDDESTGTALRGTSVDSHNNILPIIALMIGGSLALSVVAFNRRENLKSLFIRWKTYGLPTSCDHFFISHSRNEGDFVDRLRADLESHDFNICEDIKDIPGTRKFATALNQALMECGCVILVVSSEALHSDYVKSDLDYARKGAKRVIPVLLEKIDYSELRLIMPKMLQDIDFSDDNEYEAGLEKLVQQLQKGRKGIRGK